MYVNALKGHGHDFRHTGIRWVFFNFISYNALGMHFLSSIKSENQSLSFKQDFKHK